MQGVEEKLSKSTEPEASRQKVLPIIRGMKVVCFSPKSVRNIFGNATYIVTICFFSFLMKIMENRLYQNFCFAGLECVQVVQTASMSVGSGMFHASKLSIIIKNKFQFTMLWERLHYLLIFFIKVFQNCHHMKKKIKEYASKIKHSKESIIRVHQAVN